MGYQKLKGTNDFYNDLALKKAYIENVSRSVCKTYNIKEIVTPIIENTEVFVRSSGDSSDVVTKEMYTFKDKGDNSITLRPEGTASVVRCFLENKLYALPGLKKYYYVGSMFRYERPQKGRYREFIQFGVEYYGDNSYYLDCEVIMLAVAIFDNLGLKGKYKVCINTIGDFASRKVYQEALTEYFSKYIDELCPDCKKRLLKNPMRILDCKADKDSDILKNAPKIKDYLTQESKDYFKCLCDMLDYLGCEYYTDDNLVRGLDYYTDTVFEFIIKDDGELTGGLANLAMGAGGKYADLIKKFGGPDIPGIGFAFGLERVIELLDYFKLYPLNSIENNVDITFITLDNDSKKYAMKLERLLKADGIVCEMDYSNCNMKPQFKLSERVNSRYIAIIGESEREEKVVSLKDTIKGTQKKVNINELITYIRGEK